jgi:hypothetical protein
VGGWVRVCVCVCVRSSYQKHVSTEDTRHVENFKQVL